jgi:hypothetical protein
VLKKLESPKDNEGREMMLAPRLGEAVSIALRIDQGRFP